MTTNVLRLQLACSRVLSEGEAAVGKLEEALLPYRQVTPWEKVVRRVAELLGGPADGNLPAHVESYMLAYNQTCKDLFDARCRMDEATAAAARLGREKEALADTLRRERESETERWQRQLASARAEGLRQAADWHDTQAVLFGGIGDEGLAESAPFHERCAAELRKLAENRG